VRRGAASGNAAAKLFPGKCAALVAEYVECIGKQRVVAEKSEKTAVFVIGGCCGMCKEYTLCALLYNFV